MRCSADDLQGLEQLCRGVTRPALANVRVQTNAVEQVVLKLKTPWREGTAHLAMSPLEFMQRLAALVRWCHSQICSGDFVIVYVTCGSIPPADAEEKQSAARR